MGLWCESQPLVRKVRKSLDGQTHCFALFIGWIEEEIYGLMPAVSLDRYEHTHTGGERVVTVLGNSDFLLVL